MFSQLIGSDLGGSGWEMSCMVWQNTRINPDMVLLRISLKDGVSKDISKGESSQAAGDVNAEGGLQHMHVALGHPV